MDYAFFLLTTMNGNGRLRFIALDNDLDVILQINDKWIRSYPPFER
jgi:hypothetical protein